MVESKPIPFGQIFLFLGIVVGCLVVGRTVWNSVRDSVATSDEYFLTADKITFTPQPDWIRADVASQIIRNGNLTEVGSILDEDLTERIHTAVRLHPWVESASVKVTYPAAADVEIVYRKPVAMVEVPGGLLPVDRLSVLLPSDDFTAESVALYPRIAGIAAGPSGNPGTDWGDEHLNGAVKVAQALAPHWKQFELNRLQPIPAPLESEKPEFELHSQLGWSAVWGHAPGEEPEGETPAAEKIDLLTRRLTTLQDDGTDPKQWQIDLRSAVTMIRP